MHGERSQFLEFEEYNPEIESFPSKIRAKKYESKKKMVEEQTPPPKQLKEYFIPATYDSLIRIRMPIVMGQFEMKYSLI